MQLYREGLKNREFGQEGSPDFLAGASSSAREHLLSEDRKYGGKPTPAGTDFSVMSGIYLIIVGALWRLEAPLRKSARLFLF